VHNTWSKRLQSVQGSKTLEKDCQQVKKCIEIALKCKDEKRRNRPTIESVINQLNETEKHKKAAESLMEKVRSLVVQILFY
jgi:hypothetical protein